MKILGSLVIFIGFLSSTLAKDAPEESADQWRHNFDAGQWEATTGAGIFFSPFFATDGRPTVNYAGLSGQFGYMLNDLADGGPWRGNFEAMGEVWVNGIFVGSGSYLAGTTFWMRYNLVPPRGKLTPFFQLGAGVSNSDVDREVFGQAFSFNLNAGIGFRYFVDTHCSLNAEYRLQHISNANTSKHNLGINAQGAVLSVSWYF
jgi:hypothetical protein